MWSRVWNSAPVAILFCGLPFWPIQAPAAQPEETPEQQARTVLKTGSAESEADVRVQVASALILISSRDSSAALLETLATDKDHLVREAAITTIGELGDARRAPIARKALMDDVPEVTFAAARTLYRLREPEAQTILLSIVAGETRAESGFLQGKFRDVARRIKTPRSALMFGLQQGAVFVPIPGVGSGISAMSSMFFDQEFSARALALLALARDRTAAIRKVVVEALGDEDWSVRAAAVQSLVQWGRPDYRRHLLPLLDDGNKRVRYRAAAAYLRLNYLGKRRDASRTIK